MPSRKHWLAATKRVSSTRTSSARTLWWNATATPVCVRLCVRVCAYRVRYSLSISLSLPLSRSLSPTTCQCVCTGMCVVSMECVSLCILSFKEFLSWIFAPCVRLYLCLEISSSMTPARSPREGVQWLHSPRQEADEAALSVTPGLDRHASRLRLRARKEQGACDVGRHSVCE